MTPELARWAGAIGLAVLGATSLWASRRLVLARHPGGVILAPVGVACLLATAASVALLTGHGNQIWSWMLLLAIIPVDFGLAWYVVRHARSATSRQHDLDEVARAWSHDG